MAKKKGQKLTVVTIKSDEIDESTLKKIRKEFKKAMKSGGKSKIAIFGVGAHESIEVVTVET